MRAREPLRSFCCFRREKKKESHRVVPADAEAEHEPPDHEPDGEREAADRRGGGGLPDRGRDHDDEGQEVHRLAALFVAEIARVFIIIIIIGRGGKREREREREVGLGEKWMREREREREGRQN